jgi:hypothetical protein
VKATISSLGGREDKKSIKTAKKQLILGQDNPKKIELGLRRSNGNTTNKRALQRKA